MSTEEEGKTLLMGKVPVTDPPVGSDPEDEPDEERTLLRPDRVMPKEGGAAPPEPPPRSDKTYFSAEAPPPSTPTPVGESTAMRALSDAMVAGRELYGYKIDKVLGQGGFGITYRARDTKLNTYVAIKEFLPNSLAHRAPDETIQPNSAQDAEIFDHLKHRFLQEAQTLAQFRHPNLVRVMAFFEQANTALIVMDYEEGVSLSEIFQKKKTLEERELLDIMLPLLDGVAALHKQGFIHRDIKPGNILVRDLDSKPVLLDFGSARSVAKKGSDPSGTMTSMFTPSYAPVEQYFDEASRQGPWTDIYALAAVMYHAISGARPSPSIQRGGIFFGNDDDPLPPAVKVGEERYSAATLQAIDWGLKVKETDRPQSIEEWLTAFDGEVVAPSKPRLPERKVVGAPPAAAAEAVPPPAKANSEQAKYMVLGLVVGVVLVFAGLVAGVYIFRSGNESKSEARVTITASPSSVTPPAAVVAPPAVVTPPAAAVASPAAVVAPPAVVTPPAAVVAPPAVVTPPAAVVAPPAVVTPPATVMVEAKPTPPVAPSPAPDAVSTMVATLQPSPVMTAQAPGAALPAAIQAMTLELSTSRGNNRPEFHLNEVIRIIARVNKPAYLYLFDLDADGNAVLLYPPPGSKPHKLEPGKELHLPGPDSPFDMVVQPPYGKDTIWALATPTPMDLKIPSNGMWRNGQELRSRLRTTILPKHQGYSESQMEVITKP